MEGNDDKSIRVIAISLGINLVATAVAYYLGGERAAITIFIVGLFLIVLGWFWPKKSKPPSPPLPSQPNEQRVEANPRQEQHVYIGSDVLRQTASPLPQPEVRPELELIGCKTTMIVYDTHWSEVNPAQLRSRDEYKPNAFIAIFRVKPSPVGQRALYADNATAHLTYRNGKGDIQTVDYGTWLGKYEHKASFRGNAQSLVLSSTSTAETAETAGQTYVLDNHNSFDIFDQPFSGRTINPPDEKPLLSDCTEVEVEIRMFNSTLFHGKFKRIGDGWQPI